MITSLDFYFEDSRPVPSPSRLRRGAEFVELSRSVVAKVLLLNAMLDGHVRPIDLATRFGVTNQEVNRLLNLRHSKKIDAVAKALQAVGKNLELQVL